MHKDSLIIFWILIVVFLLMMGFLVNSEFEKADVYAQELEQFGVITEALTFGNVVNNISRTNREKSLNYIYFVDEKRFEFNKVSGGTGTRFDRFRNPQLLQVIYSKKNPRNHRLVLSSSIDSVRNKDLEFYIKNHFDLLNIDEFYKLVKGD
jgi:hypothetical protein